MVRCHWLELRERSLLNQHLLLRIDDFEMERFLVFDLELSVAWVYTVVPDNLFLRHLVRLHVCL